MNRYRVYFTDGFTKEVSAMNVSEAEWKALMMTSRPSSDIRTTLLIV